MPAVPPTVSTSRRCFRAFHGPLSPGPSAWGTVGGRNGPEVRLQTDSFRGFIDAVFVRMTLWVPRGRRSEVVAAQEGGVGEAGRRVETEAGGVSSPPPRQMPVQKCCWFTTDPLFLMIRHGP